MDDSIDREKAVDCLFDLNNSEIIAELEDGEKELSYLASKSNLSKEQILDNLSYLFEVKILIKSVREDTEYISADHKKLSDIVESDGNFDAAVDGLTKMDGYLN